MLAANHGHTEIVKLLLSRADIDVRLQDKVRHNLFCYCINNGLLCFLISYHSLRYSNVQAGKTALNLTGYRDIQLLILTQDTNSDINNGGGHRNSIKSSNNIKRQKRNHAEACGEQ